MAPHLQNRVHGPEPGSQDLSDRPPTSYMARLQSILKPLSAPYCFHALSLYLVLGLDYPYHASLPLKPHVLLKAIPHATPSSEIIRLISLCSHGSMLLLLLKQLILLCSLVSLLYNDHSLLRDHELCSPAAMSY